MTKTEAAAEPTLPGSKLTGSEMIKRASCGDEAAFKELRALLDMEPSMWLEFGDLGDKAEVAWRSMVAGENLVLKRGIEKKLAAMRIELGNAEASALERLLIDRVCLTWLSLHYAENIRVQLMQRGGLSWEAGEYYDRRVSVAQKRYLAAIRALATVRRLLTPRPTQVQVAHADQVNVAGDGAKQVNVAPSAAIDELLPQLPPVTAEPAKFIVVQPVRQEAVLNGRAK